MIEHMWNMTDLLVRNSFNAPKGQIVILRALESWPKAADARNEVSPIDAQMREHVMGKK
jgi:hypothetical protein